MQKIEDVKAPVIGETYWVPTVEVDEPFFNTLRAYHTGGSNELNERTLRRVPVMGPLHEDREIIDFPDNHWHIDWRFVNDRLYYSYDRLRMRSFMQIVSNIMLMVLREDRSIPDSMAYMQLEMVRDMGLYPNPVFRAALHHKYEGHKLKDCLTCPHRGIPLQGLPSDVDGVVKCPGHGLNWNVNTKELAPL